MKDKRLILITALIVIVTIVFWSGSRYPALNEKVVMGTDTTLSGLGFDTLVTIAPEASVFERILYTGVNWLYTNKEGMTFGIVFGTLLMVFLSLPGLRMTNNPLANTLMGVLVGIPLGVCVNCAAPIAKAIHDVNGRTETMLATMISSPTLNVIAITLLLSLFPFYLVLIKVGLTIGFILIAIPLFTYLIPTVNAEAELVAEPPTMPTSIFPSPSTIVNQGFAASSTWVESIQWLARNVVKNLWFLCKTTIPLMLIAGVLGSALVVALPLDSLVDYLPTSGRGDVLLGMVGVAIIGILLPVPITFDVILAAALWQAGLPIQYSMTLLFTLGVFSIFPFFIVWRSLGGWMASTLIVTLAALGIIAGVFSYWSFQLEIQSQQQFIYEHLQQESDLNAGPKQLRLGRGDGDVKTIGDAPLIATEVPGVHIYTDTIRLDSFPLKEPIPSPGKVQFKRYEGSQLGISRPYNFSISNFEGPFTQFRGIASGDVHNDGWVDVLMTNGSGISLFSNIEGRKFVLQEISVPDLERFSVVHVALVDINNDGWLDIFAATYEDGNFVIQNNNGSFGVEGLREFPANVGSPMIASAAFADIDKDGDLDVVTGNWAPPLFHGIGEMKTNIHVLLRQPDGNYARTPLPRSPGSQILSILLTDFNNDGHLDIIAGGEDSAPDSFYIGSAGGEFQQVRRGDGLIPHSGGTTMSITSADINNDLVQEIYIGQIVESRDVVRLDTGPEVCDEIVSQSSSDDCISILKMHQQMPGQTRSRNVMDCLSPDTQEYRFDCIAYALLLNTREQGPVGQCELFPAGWEFFQSLCTRGYNGGGPLFAQGNRPYDVNGLHTDYWHDAIPALLDTNILLMQQEDGNFKDDADQKGISMTGFTWNSKFADLDNDEYMDLYVANGWFPGAHRVSNIYFRNIVGESFENQTEETGLVSYLATSAYTYVDIDNDGDLDIITAPLIGSAVIFVNGSVNNRVVFELRDHVGNHFGVGSTVTIHYGIDGIRHQQRVIRASGGFLSFDAPLVYFGLGEFEQIERVEVRWSTGETSILNGDIRQGNRYTITRKKLEAAR